MCFAFSRLIILRRIRLLICLWFRKLSNCLLIIFLLLGGICLYILLVMGFFVFFLQDKLDDLVLKAIVFIDGVFCFDCFLFCQLSTGCLGNGEGTEYHCLLGNWIRQNPDCYHASAQLCSPVAQTLDFSCCFSGPHCGAGFPSMSKQWTCGLFRFDFYGINLIDVFIKF